MEECGNVKKYHEISGTENDRYKEVTAMENTTAHCVFSNFCK